MKKFGLFFLVVLILGGLYGVYEYNREVEGLEDKEADYSLTANELFDAFEQNEAEAQKLYVDKIIAVEGELIRIKESDSTASLTLKADNAMMGGVNCGFSKLPKNLKEGQNITVKGRCQGYLMEVILNNCVIEK